jgi:hypothetical protein
MDRARNCMMRFASEKNEESMGEQRERTERETEEEKKRRKKK